VLRARVPVGGLRIKDSVLKTLD